MTSISTDKVSYLRSKNYCIGSRPTQAFVDGLYTLASKDLLSAERWNVLGDVKKPWDKQSSAILSLSKGELDVPEKITTEDAKAKYLDLKGYWLGKKPGAGVVDNLYALKDKIAAKDWNKKGIAGLAWEKQSEEFRSPAAPAVTLPPLSEPSPPPAASPIPETATVKKDIAAVAPEPASPPVPQLPDKEKAEDTARVDAEAVKQQKIKDLKALLVKIKESTYADALVDPALFSDQKFTLRSFRTTLQPNRIREIEKLIVELQEGK